MKRLGMLVAALATFVSFQASQADESLSAAANAAYLANNAHKPGVYVRPSGLQYRVVQYGNGKRPGPLDTVTVYYKGSLINGKVFDATEPGLPATFPVNKLIPGWTEALQLMRVGARTKSMRNAGMQSTSRAGSGAPSQPICALEHNRPASNCRRCAQHGRCTKATWPSSAYPRARVSDSRARPGKVLNRKTSTG